MYSHAKILKMLNIKIKLRKPKYRFMSGKERISSILNLYFISLFLAYLSITCRSVYVLMIALMLFAYATKKLYNSIKQIKV